MKIKARRKALPLFKYLLKLGRHEVRPLPSERKSLSKNGVGAIEWFVANESQGQDLPTKHPLIVEKVIIGRWLKGLTKDMWIEDLRNGTIYPSEVKDWAYSPSDAQDVLNRAAK